MGIEFERAFERSNLPIDQLDAFTQGWNSCVDYIREKRGHQQVPGSPSQWHDLLFPLGLLTLMVSGSMGVVYGLNYFLGDKQLRPVGELAPYMIVGGIIGIWCLQHWWKTAKKSQRAWDERWGQKP